MVELGLSPGTETRDPLHSTQRCLLHLDPAMGDWIEEHKGETEVDEAVVVVPRARKRS